MATDPVCGMYVDEASADLTFFRENRTYYFCSATCREQFAAPRAHLKQLRRELAVALYGARKLTLVQAADVAQSGLFEFQALLRDRRIPQHYDESDLDQDLLALRELPPR